MAQQPIESTCRPIGATPPPNPTATDPCCPETNAHLTDINVGVTTTNTALATANTTLTDILTELKKPELDREFSILCTKAGKQVIIQNVTPEGAPLGTAPVIEAWNLDGTPYTGNIALLVDCGSEQVDVSSAVWLCADGADVSRTDFWDISVTPRVLTGSLWQDTLGTVIPAPANAIAGKCEVCQPKTFLEFAYYKDAVTTTTGNTDGSVAKWGFDYDPNVGFYNFGMADVSGTTSLADILNAWWIGTDPTFAITLPADDCTGVSFNTTFVFKRADIVSASVNYGAGSFFNFTTALNSNPTNPYPNNSPVCASPDNYNWFNAPWAIGATGNTAGDCRKIEIIKILNCDNTLKLLGYELDGTAIAAFDPTKIVAGEPAKEKEYPLCAIYKDGTLWNVLERIETTPCGDVVTSYWNADVRPMVEVPVADITVIHAGECNCCSKPPVNLPALVAKKSYGGGIGGINFGAQGFKFDIALAENTPVRWTIKVWLNGTSVWTSPQSPSLTSFGAAQTWIDTIGGGGYFASSGTWISGTAPDFKLPINALPTDEWLVVIQEDVQGGNTLNSLVSYGYSTNGTAFGFLATDYISLLAMGGLITWANRLLQQQNIVP